MIVEEESLKKYGNYNAVCLHCYTHKNYYTNLVEFTLRIDLCKYTIKDGYTITEYIPYDDKNIKIILTTKKRNSKSLLNKYEEFTHKISKDIVKIYIDSLEDNIINAKVKIFSLFEKEFNNETKN